MTIEIKFKNGSIQEMELGGGYGSGFGGEFLLQPIVKTQIRLRENSVKRNDNSPDYFVQCPEWNGEKFDWYDCGSAWWKVPADENSEVDKFLSIQLDRADLDKKYDFAAFVADDEDQPKDKTDGLIWRLVYNRKKRSGEKSAVKNAPPLPNDGIPY